ncbi:MAG TPA: TRAP transporter small permease [Pseudorhodoplanes sp.]|jgi:TRAP-type C4-dicarboxylate transport system permease small subunit|nr:TRAP transporter small permease [Pseudorhodoplanes sp.]
MKAQYIRLMDLVHQACVFISGACLAIIVLIVPYGVFCRYVLNSAASWPEPLAVLLMIVLSFLSAVVCYREYLHIGVGILPAFLGGAPKQILGWIIEICMLATNVFMLVWGIRLCEATWDQTIAEFPAVSVGLTYLPIPVSGGLTILFVFERFLTQEFFSEPEAETVSQLTTE